LLSIIHKLDETVQIEKSVSYMLCYYLTMEINEDLCIWAHHPLILVISIELSTVYTSVEDGRALVLAI